MNGLILLMILVVTTFEYFVQINLLPHVAKYLPETLSALMVPIIVAQGARNRFQFVRAAYWFAFGALATTIICGVLANSVGSGPLFAGMRTYLRALPLFFLPAVYPFSEKQIRSQLWLLLALCVLQLPVAIRQRMATAAYGGITGDYTAGTVQLSGNLSVFLICAACILTAAFLKKRVRAIWFLPLFLLLLLPTTINETKATVFLLPVGLLTTFLAASPRGARTKNAIVAVSLLTVFGAIFVPVYDYLIAMRPYGTPITEFFTSEKKFSRYVTNNAEVGANKVKRVDAIVTPLREMLKDPVHLAFGFGIGNVSLSSLGTQFTGKYNSIYQPFLQSSASVFILEIGLFGVALVFVINYLIYRDSRVVADADNGLMGMLGVGWAGVTAVIAMSMFYVDCAGTSAIAYLFWYVSGIIAAHRVRLSREDVTRYGVRQHRSVVGNAQNST